jgi:Xaa-Pro aminopeptidase
MKDRLESLRARMAECEAFISLAPPTNQYLTGFRGSTSAVVVTRDQAEFLCDFRYVEQAADQVEAFEIEEVTGNLATRVGEHLTALGVGRAAFEGSAMTVAQHADIGGAFTGELEADDQLVSAMRMVKSAEEVEQVRAAALLADGVLADLLEGVDGGMTERELAARFEYEFKRRGASGASFDTIALFGARSSLPHGEPGDKELEPGDVVLLDFGCRRDGYCSDLTRTYVFGTIPGAWFEEVYELVLTAQRIALEALRPGLSCRELDAVARQLITEAGHGEHFGHGLGHGVGIEIHEAPRLNTQSDTVLEPGMIVTVEPGVYLPGRGGVRIEDLVAVTAAGAEVLSTAPKELRILST